MDTLSITFKHNGKEKKFTVQPKITEKFLNGCAKHSLKLDNATEFLDRVKYTIQFMVYIFDEQFTYDEIVDGLEINELLEQSARIFKNMNDMMTDYRLKHQDSNKTNFIVIEGGLCH